MKTRTLVVFLCFILFWNCKEEPILDPVIIPDPVSEKEYLVSASADFGVTLNPYGDSVVRNGDSIIFSYEVASGRSIQSIKVNDNPVYSQTNSNYKLLEGNRISIKVKENAKLKLKSICNDSLKTATSRWYLQHTFLGTIQASNDTIWKEGIPEPRLYTDYLVITLDGFFSEIDASGHTFGGPFPWSLSGDTIKLANLEYKFSVSDSTLTLYFFYPNGEIEKEIFAHAPLDPALRLTKK